MLPFPFRFIFSKGGVPPIYDPLKETMLYQLGTGLSLSLYICTWRTALLKDTIATNLLLSLSLFLSLYLCLSLYWYLFIYIHLLLESSSIERGQCHQLPVETAGGGPLAAAWRRTRHNTWEGTPGFFGSSASSWFWKSERCWAAGSKIRKKVIWDLLCKILLSNFAVSCTLI